MLVGLILFLIFLDRFLHRLRPVAVAVLVARAGRAAFEEEVAAAAARETPDVLPPDHEPAEASVRVVRSAGAGAIQGVDGRGLVRFANANRVSAGAAAHRRRLRAGGRRARRGLRQRPGCRRRGAAEGDDRPRRGAHHRAGSRVRDPDHGRHRQQGTVSRGERSHHRRAGAQPSRRHAAVGGLDPAAASVVRRAARCSCPSGAGRNSCRSA